MIVDSLHNADHYGLLHRSFPLAFQFLRSPALDSLTVGTHKIDGNKVFAMVAKDQQAKPRGEARLEAHRKYIDVQYIVGGNEEMGWKSLSGCRSVSIPYDVSKDIEFFKDSIETWVRVPSGHFAVFFPEDAHAPLIGEGLIHKVIVKIQVA